jgi:hypothetical protein
MRRSAGRKTGVGFTSLRRVNPSPWRLLSGQVAFG